MKLHLGCGNKRFEGYLNIDLQGSELDCDIRKLPFDDEYSEEIVAIHVVEHFMITEVADILKEWRRVLKPGGILTIELPCWDKVQEHIKKGSPDNMTRWPLFGDPRTHVDGFPAVHKWCYSRQEMGNLLKHVGFTEVIEETPKFHVPSRDMRWISKK